MRQATARPIKDYCLGIYDGPHATPQESTEGPIFLGIKNITDDGRLDLSEIRNLSEEDFSKWTRRVMLQANDIVFTYEATLHRYATIPEGFRGCLGRRVALVRPNPDQVDSRYLLYFFLSEGWRRVVESNIITGATVDRIPIEKFPDFPVILPKLSAQRKIGSVLSPYDDLIENNRRRMELLEEAARQLYREWFVRLRFPGREHTRIINGVPEGWEQKTVTDIWAINYGKNLPTKNISQSGKFPVHGADSVIGYYDESNVDVSVCLVTCRGNGSCNVRRTYGPAFVTNNSFIFRPQKSFEDVHFHFAMFCLETLCLRELRTGAAQPQLTLSGINHLQVLIPRKSLLRLFNDHADLLFRQSDNLRIHNLALAQARDLLLPRLMSGQIAV